MSRKGQEDGLFKRRFQRIGGGVGVVIGPAVQCLMDAVDGGDTMQWKIRWADDRSGPNGQR